MNLNIGGSGTVKPYAKYNAKADKWFVRGPDGEDAEIARPNFVIDFDNIATGWLCFREGQAPERVMDQSLERAAPCPGEGFKRGFVVMAFSPKFFGGVAEFASASIHLSNAIKEVYAQYQAECTGHPGQLPVLSCTGSQAMKDRYGTNYRPTFDIISWVDRPADLVDASPVDPADLWQGEASASPTRPAPAQHVPPPVASSPVTPPPVASSPVTSPAAAVEDPLSQSVF